MITPAAFKALSVARALTKYCSSLIQSVPVNKKSQVAVELAACQEAPSVVLDENLVQLEPTTPV